MDGAAAKFRAKWTLVFVVARTASWVLCFIGFFTNIALSVFALIIGTAAYIATHFFESYWDAYYAGSIELRRPIDKDKH